MLATERKFDLKRDTFNSETTVYLSWNSQPNLSFSPNTLKKVREVLKTMLFSCLNLIWTDFDTSLNFLSDVFYSQKLLWKWFNKQMMVLRW